MNLSISLFTDFNKAEICCKENSFKLFFLHIIRG